MVGRIVANNHTKAIPLQVLIIFHKPLIYLKALSGRLSEWHTLTDKHGALYRLVDCIMIARSRRMRSLWGLGYWLRIKNPRGKTSCVLPQSEAPKPLARRDRGILGVLKENMWVPSSKFLKPETKTHPSRKLQTLCHRWTPHPVMLTMMVVIISGPPHSPIIPLLQVGGST